MKIGVYFCNCGANIAGKVDVEKIKMDIAGGDTYFETVDMMCSGDGTEQLSKSLKERRPERVVIGACSPRDFESTFMDILSGAGINPYLMQMANLRELVTWVTTDREQATRKSIAYLRAAVARVRLHDALVPKQLDIVTDVLVIGAGPAGIKAALAAAESGRKVVLVEKSPVIGGMPVRYQEIAPRMECGPCMLEPLENEIFYGDIAKNIELMTMAEVVDAKGSFGNFLVQIKRRPRYIDTVTCIGCQECIAPCPVTTAKNEFDYGMSKRRAIAFPFPGAMPNVPYIDMDACLRSKGDDCQKCKEVCPVEGAVKWDDTADVVERNVGAIIIAIGAEVYDCKKISELGHGRLPGVYSSVEFERMLAANGPTAGEIKTPAGEPPAAIAIVHCVGSLEAEHRPYCSGVCCMTAFKFNHLLGKKLPSTKVYHLYKEISLPGKEEYAMYDHAMHNKNSEFVRYRKMTDLNAAKTNGKISLTVGVADGTTKKLDVDMIVLNPALVPAGDTAALGDIFEAGLDRYGFFEEMNNRIDAAKSKIKGVYLAGTCQSPMDIQKAMNQAMASTGNILSQLVAGRKLVIQPITAVIDPERCSGCKVCNGVCPYKAISFDEEKEVSVVNDVLCTGCGTCVAACPAAAIKGNHFTSAEISAEIDAVLA